MYVVGGLDENELMLFNVVLALRDTLLLMLRYVEATVGVRTSSRFGTDMMDGPND
jgi:hypothetical protein